MSILTGEAKWTTQLPIWVSRKTGDGIISQVSVPLYIYMYLIIVLLLNLILWSGFALYEWFSVVL